MIAVVMPLLLLVAGILLMIRVRRQHMRAGKASLSLTALLVVAWCAERAFPLPPGPDDPFGLAWGFYCIALLCIWTANASKKSRMDRQ